MVQSAPRTETLQWNELYIKTYFYNIKMAVNIIQEYDLV